MNASAISLPRKVYLSTYRLLQSQTLAIIQTARIPPLVQVKCQLSMPSLVARISDDCHTYKTWPQEEVVEGEDEARVKEYAG